MARIARTTSADTPQNIDPGELLTDWLEQAQKMQVDALNGWQEAMAGQVNLVSSWMELQAELAKPANSVWDGWIAQWTGGVPIDG